MGFGRATFRLVHVAVAVGPGCEFETVAHVEFQLRGGEVLLDRAEGDVQAVGGLGVGEAGGGSPDQAMGMEIAPNNVNDVRLKLKRLVERGILAETEQRVFSPPRP